VALGKPQSTVGRWESAVRQPSLETLRASLQAMGLELAVGIARRDNSYHALIARRLELTPQERLAASDTGESGADSVAVLAALAGGAARFIVIGAVAAALHGSPLHVGSRGVEIVPAEDEESTAALHVALRGLGAHMLAVDDTYRGLADLVQWELPRGGAVTIVQTPADTRGYDDLRRTCQRMRIGELLVDVASVRDLARIAEASPRAEDRVGIVALRAIDDVVDRRAAGALDQRSAQEIIASWQRQTA
jgi:hypothetical protein